jgi:dienelactone hydrolase
MHHTGAALAKQGYVVLCPDALGFEEREQGNPQKGRNLERFLFLKYVVEGQCMAWKNIHVNVYHKKTHHFECCSLNICC